MLVLGDGAAAMVGVGVGVIVVAAVAVVAVVAVLFSLSYEGKLIYRNTYMFDSRSRLDTTS